MRIFKRLSSSFLQKSRGPRKLRIFTKRCFVPLNISSSPSVDEVPVLDPSSLTPSLTHGIHVFNCPDEVGIVAKLSDRIASRGGNILAAEIFVPHKKQTFYSRSEFVFDPAKWPRAQIEEDFLKLSTRFKAVRSVVRVPDLDPKFKIAVLASKQDHCLVDMLLGWQDGKLPVDIKCVISREVSRDREFSRDMTSHGDVPSRKSKFKSNPPPQDHHHPRARSERPERLSPDRSTHDPEPLRTSSKRKMKYEDDYYEEHPHQHREKERRYHHRSESEPSAARSPIPPETVDLPPLPSKSSTDKTVADRKHKASVFARITFPEGESAASKKRKLGSSPPSAVNGSSHHSSHSHRVTSNGYHEDHHKTATAVSKNSYSYADDHDYESSDDDRHFKRRPSRYEASPVPAVEEGRHSSRRSRERERGHSSKHR